MFKLIWTAAVTDPSDHIELYAAVVWAILTLAVALSGSYDTAEGMLSLAIIVYLICRYYRGIMSLRKRSDWVGFVVRLWLVLSFLWVAVVRYLVGDNIGLAEGVAVLFPLLVGPFAYWAARFITGR